MAENIKLYQAAENEIEEITKLYEQAKGSEYCTWDEHYPNIEITRQDLKRNDLFCMKTETGEIVGAISIDDDKEVEGLSCWSDKLKPSVEIARLVVKKEWQNKKIEDKKQKKALSAYKKLNFERVGESTLYDGNWWCYERKVFEKTY